MSKILFSETKSILSVSNNSLPKILIDKGIRKIDISSIFKVFLSKK